MLLRPAYKLTLGSRVMDSKDRPQGSTLVSLHVTASMDAPIDSFTAVIARVGQAAGNSGGGGGGVAGAAAGAAAAIGSALGGGGSGAGSFPPAVGDKTRVELGYADDGGLTLVAGGTVAAVEPDMTTIRVLGYSACHAALRTYVDQTYENITAGDLVRALADKAGVSVNTADDGIRFPAYVIDGRRTVYYHMLDVAALSGFDLYVQPDGGLVFKKFTGGRTVHVFEYAKHIVALDVVRTPQAAGQVEVWGESPTGTKGDQSWPWLTKDFSSSKGTAGSGPLFLLEHPALRTGAAAQTAADAALLAIRRRTLRAELSAQGSPDVLLGDAVELRGLPDTSLNVRFQVRSIGHRVTKIGGFTTRLGLRAIDVS